MVLVGEPKRKSNLEDLAFDARTLKWIIKK
jgi:hypothetical protein